MVSSSCLRERVESMQRPRRGAKPKAMARFSVSPTLRQPAPELGPRAMRTIASILAATKEIFLTRGYAGTTVDEIARVANVSRASFYTYFPTKRDVLLTLAADSAHIALEIVDHVRKIEQPWTDADIAGFVREHFAMLDEHGSFVFAWTQAAHEDEEIRAAGMKGHLEICRRLGGALGELRGKPFDDPTAQGLAIFSMVERSWSYCQLYADTVDPTVVQREIAYAISATLRTS
jgi:AcrR family transcriptional regulator